MRSLGRRPAAAPVRPAAAPVRRDPAPSRWSYRFQRWMLTPGLRKLIIVGTPTAIVLSIGALWYSRDANREWVAQSVDSAFSSFQNRAEFLVQIMSVDGADEALSADIRTVLPLEFPVSSFDLDLEAMRQTVAALPAVADATMRVRPGGVLEVSVDQRRPIAVFRDADGLRLIDEDGILIGAISARADRRDLPLVTGDGARDKLAEGLALYRAGGPIRHRMRAVVRMGERRWDVVLESGQRILLPTQDPITAFERVIVLDQTRQLLARDVAVVDMRNADRPTLRMNADAAEAFRTSAAHQDGNG